MSRAGLAHCSVKSAEPAPLNARSPVDVEATKTKASKHWLGTSTLADLVTALRLEEAGAATVMPLGSMIGSGQGVSDYSAIRRMY